MFKRILKRILNYFNYIHKEDVIKEKCDIIKKKYDAIINGETYYRCGMITHFKDNGFDEKTRYYEIHIYLCFKDLTHDNVTLIKSFFTDDYEFGLMCAEEIIDKLNEQY